MPRRLLTSVLVATLTLLSLAFLGSRAMAAPRNTRLVVGPVFDKTLTGDFDSAGNTLLQCDTLTNGQPLPAAGCEHDITKALGPNPGPAFYNNQVSLKYLDRDANPSTHSSSSATVTVPAGAKVVFANLEWIGTSQKTPNPNLQWDPNIWQRPMLLSVGDDQHYRSITPDRGTSVQPGSPPSDTNDYYYTASADVTSLVQADRGSISFWGANAPFPANGFNQAGSGWDIVVVYQFDQVDVAAGHVGKRVTIQDGFVYQQQSSPPTNNIVTIPQVTDASQVRVGLIDGEGDAGLTGDQFKINGQNIAHPVTGQTNNFFVSYAQGATDPNWTSNMSVGDVSWVLKPGIVHTGDTSVTLTTVTSGDGFMLRGLNTSIPVPAIDLRKTVDPTYTTVGDPLTYTFTVTNSSALTLDDVTLNDPNLGGAVPSCAHPGALASGASYSCTADHVITLGDIRAGTIDNTATVTGSDEVGDKVTDTASAVSTTSTNVEIVKTGAPKPVHAGDPFTYTIAVTNNGPGDAADVTVRDPLPTGLDNPTASATNGATVDINGATLTATKTLLTHAAPNTFTITVNGTVANPFPSAAALPILTNTATVETPNSNCLPAASGEDVADPCTSTDDTPVLKPAAVTISKTTSDATPKPGDTFDYTVTVTNTSSTTDAAATVDDAAPAPLTFGAWTCSATDGSTCTTADGTGDISGVALTLAPKGVATFVIEAKVPADYQGDRNPITNVATTTPGDHTVCADDPAADTCAADVPVDPVPDPAQLTITKTHTPINPSPPPGAAITYTVTVTNTSASTVAHGTFDDPVPDQITADGTWTTATTGTGTTAAPANGTGFPENVALTMAPGGTVTFTITAHVSNPYNGSNVTNIASVTPGTNTGCEDGQPTCDAEDSFTSPPRLVVAKTRADPTTPLRPGDQVTYTVVVTNPVSGPAGTGTFTDTLPAELDATTATWTCAPSGAGSTCGAAAGTGSPTGVVITVASNGGTVTFTITATIRPSQVPISVHNIATVTPTGPTECVDGGPTCTGDDNFDSTPPPAPLHLTKSHVPTGPDPVQGDDVTYTITVSNQSDTTQARGTVTDTPDIALTGLTWTATAQGGATVDGGSTANGTGAFGDVAVVLPVGATVVFTVHATVRAGWLGGKVVNTAVATPGDNTVCDPESSCGGTDVFPLPAPITIQKELLLTDPLPKPGQRAGYAVLVTNLSLGATARAMFRDPLPGQFIPATVRWTATTFITGTTATPASGTGSPSGVALVLPPGGSVLFTINAVIRPSFTGGEITNIATATPGDGTICVDRAPECPADASFTSNPDPAHVSIIKTVTTGATAKPGGRIGYRLTVTNIGSGSRARGIVTDPVPAGLTDVSWTTKHSSGSLVRPASGTGAISALVGIPAGGNVEFVVSATVKSSFDSDFDIDNVATLQPGPHTSCEPRNPGEACNTNAVIRVPVPAPGVSATATQTPLAFSGVPTLSWLAAALLLVLCGFACTVLGRRRS